MVFDRSKFDVKHRSSSFFSNLGDKLIVALNSDEWLENKKGKFFMPFSERKIILENINYVDEVIDFEDDQQGSAINAIEKVKSLYPNDQILFANGGDRSTGEVPESVVCKKHEIEMIDGLGEKIRSSSKLTGLKEKK